MSSVNYTGRKVDLLIFGDIDEDEEVQATLGFGDVGKVTTGIQKVCQEFAMMFLTDKGSIQYRPTVGTDFVRALRLQKIKDESDVKVNFAVAAEAVKRVLNSVAIKKGLPDDERLTSVVLRNFSLDKANSKLSLYVKLTTAAGAAREVFLPIPLGV